MTREQMIAEFGEPGLQNAKIMDLIELDPVSDKVVLVMSERRAWGAGPHLDCVEEPREAAIRFVRAADHASRAEGLEFIVKVTPPTVAESVGDLDLKVGDQVQLSGKMK